jgi:hypothetical protein
MLYFYNTWAKFVQKCSSNQDVGCGTTMRLCWGSVIACTNIYHEAGGDVTS